MPCWFECGDCKALPEEERKYFYSDDEIIASEWWEKYMDLIEKEVTVNGKYGKCAIDPQNIAFAIQSRAACAGLCSTEASLGEFHAFTQFLAMEIDKAYKIELDF